MSPDHSNAERRTHVEGRARPAADRFGRGVHEEDGRLDAQGPAASLDERELPQRLGPPNAEGGLPLTLRQGIG